MKNRFKKLVSLNQTNFIFALIGFILFVFAPTWKVTLISIICVAISFHNIYNSYIMEFKRKNL